MSLKESMCPERFHAEQRVVKSIEEVYRLRAKLKATVTEARALESARTEQREAQRALEAHVDQHRCQGPITA